MSERITPPTADQIFGRDTPSGCEPRDALTALDTATGFREALDMAVTYREMLQVALRHVARLTSQNRDLQARLREALDLLAEKAS